MYHDARYRMKIVYAIERKYNEMNKLSVAIERPTYDIEKRKTYPLFQSMMKTPSLYPVASIFEEDVKSKEKTCRNYIIE